MRSESQMICQGVCSWIYLAKLSDFLIRNHKNSPIDQRTESSVLSSVNFISALRYYKKRLSFACIGKPDQAYIVY